MERMIDPTLLPQIFATPNMAAGLRVPLRAGPDADGCTKTRPDNGS